MANLSYLVTYYVAELFPFSYCVIIIHAKKVIKLICRFNQKILSKHVYLSGCQFTCTV